MMRTYTYSVVEQQCCSGELGAYRTYGIQVAGRMPNGWEIVEVIHDIVFSREAAELMAALFTRYQLSPIHFRDVVEDMLP